MSEQEEQKLKRRLERSLYRGGREITNNEWEYLKVEEVINGYEFDSFETEKQRFKAFRETAKTKLETIERLFGYSSQPQAKETRASEPLDDANEEAFNLPGFVQVDEGTYKRGEAIHSRGEVIHTYEHLYKGKDADEVRPVFGSAVFVGEGGRGGTPQWIVLIHAQAWIPAEQIKGHYQRVQDDLSHERGWKTQARTFDVVRFVWETEPDPSKRPSFPELMRLWNDRRPRSVAFPNWRSFRKCFLEGEAAVLPRYHHDNKQLRGLIDNGSQVAAFDRWAEGFRRKL